MWRGALAATVVLLSVTRCAAADSKACYEFSNPVYLRGVLNSMSYLEARLNFTSWGPEAFTDAYMQGESLAMDVDQSYAGSLELGRTGADAVRFKLKTVLYGPDVFNVNLKTAAASLHFIFDFYPRRNQLQVCPDLPNVTDKLTLSVPIAMDYSPFSSPSASKLGTFLKGMWDKAQGLGDEDEASDKAPGKASDKASGKASKVSNPAPGVKEDAAATKAAARRASEAWDGVGGAIDLVGAFTEAQDFFGADRRVVVYYGHGPCHRTAYLVNDLPVSSTFVPQEFAMSAALRDEPSIIDGREALLSGLIAIPFPRAGEFTAEEIAQRQLIFTSFMGGCTMLVVIFGVVSVARKNGTTIQSMIPDWLMEWMQSAKSKMRSTVTLDGPPLYEELELGGPPEGEDLSPEGNKFVNGPPEGETEASEEEQEAPIETPEIDEQTAYDMYNELAGNNTSGTRPREVGTLFFFFAYVAICTSWPLINSEATACYEGIPWEWHQPFFMLFVACKVYEIYLFTTMKEAVGTVTIFWPMGSSFLFKFISSFFGFFDGYSDGLSIIISRACLSPLWKPMAICFVFGVVICQWLVIAVLGWFLDSSGKCFYKVLHMDVLATCIDFNPKDKYAKRMWQAINWSRFVFEDVPQTILQTLFVLTVRKNVVMVGSIMISLGSSALSVYNAAKSAIKRSLSEQEALKALSRLRLLLTKYNESEDKYATAALKQVLKECQDNNIDENNVTVREVLQIIEKTAIRDCAELAGLKILTMEFPNLASLVAGDSLQALRLGPTIKEVSLSKNTQLTSVALCEGPVLTEVRLDDNTLLTSVALSRFPVLSKVYLNGNTLLTSVALFNCPQLKEVQLGGCKQLSSVEGLGNCRQLQKADLRYCENLSSFEGLGNCRQLQEVDLRDCKKLASVQALGKCPQLVEVQLGGCEQLSSVKGLGNCRQLRKVDLDGTQLSSVEGLGNSRQLEMVSLNGCTQLSSVEGLGNCQQLEMVSFRGCTQLSSVEALGTCPQLKQVDLRGCENLSSVEGLGNCQQAYMVILDGCTQLSSVEALGNCQKLAQVYLRGCTRLSSVEALGNCPQLKLVHLSRCTKLSSVKGLGNCRQLQKVGLEGCENLSSVEALGNCPQLTEVDLSRCTKLSSVEVEQLKKSLPKAKVIDE